MKPLINSNALDFPRVLIIGHFNQKMPVGITIKNMFRKQPTQNIAVASFNNINDIYSSVCNNYYCLGKSEIQLKFPLSITQKIPKSNSYSDYQFKANQINLKKDKKRIFIYYISSKINFLLVCV